MKRLLVAALVVACGKAKPEQASAVGSAATSGDAAAVTASPQVRQMQPLRIEGPVDAEKRKTGAWTWAEGTITASVQMVNGLAEGAYHREDNEEKVTGAFASSERSGDWNYVWVSSGTTKARGRYERDRRVGRWTLFHPGQRVAAEGTYKAGERAPEWKFFALDGAPLDEAKALAAHPWLADMLPDAGTLNMDSEIVKSIMEK